MEQKNRKIVIPIFVGVFSSLLTVGTLSFLRKKNFSWINSIVYEKYDPSDLLKGKAKILNNETIYTIVDKNGNTEDFSGSYIKKLGFDILKNEGLLILSPRKIGFNIIGSKIYTKYDQNNPLIGKYDGTLENLEEKTDYILVKDGNQYKHTGSQIKAHNYVITNGILTENFFQWIGSTVYISYSEDERNNEKFLGQTHNLNDEQNYILKDENGNIKEISGSKIKKLGFGILKDESLLIINKILKFEIESFDWNKKITEKQYNILVKSNPEKQFIKYGNFIIERYKNKYYKIMKDGTRKDYKKTTNNNNGAFLTPHEITRQLNWFDLKNKNPLTDVKIPEIEETKKLKGLKKRFDPIFDQYKGFPMLPVISANNLIIGTSAEDFFSLIMKKFLREKILILLNSLNQNGSHTKWKTIVDEGLDYDKSFFDHNIHFVYEGKILTKEKALEELKNQFAEGNDEEKLMKINSFKEAKEKFDSINTYGDLGTSSASIEVNYENGDYTFQVGNKTKLNSLTELNIELNIQGDTTAVDYTIDDFGSLDIDSSTLTSAKAAAKALSIETYGDLKTNSITVNYDNAYTFLVEGKTKLNSLAGLNIELNIQGDTEEDYTIDNLPSTLNFDSTTLDAAKAKAVSIVTYGDLTTETIKVDYENNAYTFQVGENPKMNLNELNSQLNTQGDTEGEDYTIDNLPSTLNLVGLDEVKERIIEQTQTNDQENLVQKTPQSSEQETKKYSIQTNGNLKNQKIINGFNFCFVIFIFCFIIFGFFKFISKKIKKYR